MGKDNLELIRQALGAAESSIRLAKQLLLDIEGSGVTAKPKAQELPGVTGIFDGENMVAENGQSFPVPANYASKSMLVVGDTLKLVDEGKEKRFKQIEHVKRHKSSGILTKKDGKWKVVTSEGSYKVLPAAVAHFGADISSEVVLQLPANNLTVPYGAIEAIKKPESNREVQADESKEVSKPVVESKEDKKPVEKPLPKEAPKVVAEPIKESVKAKPEVKPVMKDPPVKKVDPPKPVEVKPDPKPEPPVVKEPPKETVVIKPEPLKAITIEPEPKEVVVAPTTPAPAKPVSPPPVEVPSSAKPVGIEVSPEEDELT